MQNAKIQAIVDLPAPTNNKELRQVLGLCGYYQKLVSGYADKTTLLTDLLQDKRKWQWGDKEDSAFHLLKKELTTAPILRWPNPEEPFFIEVDASDYGIGAVLSQEDAPGINRPVAFFSKKAVSGRAPLFCRRQGTARSTQGCGGISSLPELQDSDGATNGPRQPASPLRDATAIPEDHPPTLVPE